MLHPEDDKMPDKDKERRKRQGDQEGQGMGNDWGSNM